MAAIPRLKRAVNDWTKAMFVRPGLLGVVSFAMKGTPSIHTFRNVMRLCHGSLVTAMAFVANGYLLLTTVGVVFQVAGRGD